MSELRTADLVRQAQGGDHEAYERLFARVSSRLVAYVRLRLGPRLRERVDVLDVVQEAYVRAHQAFADFEQRDERAFGRWLCAIADHALKDLAEHHDAQKRRPPSPLIRGSAALARVRARHTNPASRCAREEHRERLLAALQDLEPEEREVLLLRYFQELSVAEVVGRVGRSRATVLRQLGRGRLKLGALLREPS